MQWFYNLKIMPKLLIAFITVALLTVVVGLFSVYKINELDNRNTFMYEKQTVPISIIQDMTRVFQQIRNDLLELTLAETPEARNELLKRVAASRESMGKYSDQIGATVVSAEMRAQYEKYLQARKDYAVYVEKITNLVMSGNSTAARAFMNGEGAKVQQQYQAELDKLADMKVESAKKNSEVNTYEARMAVTMVTALVAIIAILAILFGWFIARNISKPVNQLVENAKLLAQGNIDVHIQNDNKDEVGILAEALKMLAEHIRQAAATAERIAAGDLSAQVVVRSQDDVLGKSLKNCTDNIAALAADANFLVGAALAGRLSTRADSMKHQGEYRRIVDGVNQTIDAIVAPVEEAAAVLKEMAEGNLSIRVTGEYQGDHAEIKTALNTTLDAISGYVEEISRILGKMSNSDLDVAIYNEYKGDFAQIKTALNSIINSFNEVFSDINHASDQVASGSRQVSDGSQALSQGATEQASAVEELTVSIGQVASQTKDNALNANKANELSLKAKEHADEGNQHMRLMLKSMEEINESSAKISKIIKVIDEIAFQTNILALNAAVEAARAGQHGKGFAVVAEEVRNLAARSANAAKETTELIEGSVKNVDDGTQTANDTARALEEIIDDVANVAGLVGDIAAASNEQATAIAQINKGIEQVSQVVQTNSATAEESAAASEELSGQAELLKGMIAKFHLKGHDGASFHKMTPEISSYESKSVKPSKGGGVQKPRIALSDHEFGKY
ncbi:MAG: methyl-accepting chemotaxis protein [Sporomusaceae bacterium]|nr:methyl-accepting chemotaxis protein [Sporomusaceae bacterium]